MAVRTLADVGEHVGVSRSWSAFPRVRLLRLLVVVGQVGLVLWSVRWVWGPGLSSGSDVTGHLQRAEHAWDLFREGSLDGWFPGSMLGYQLHLLYGAGLAVVMGGVRVVTLGAVSAPGALQLVLVGSLVAVPFSLARLGRALGLRWVTAAAAGTLGVAASSPRGGGIEGAFETALVSQQVAVPLVVLAMALAVECLSPRYRGSPVLLAITVAALALTHPLSLVLLGVVGPAVLVAAWRMGGIEAGRFPALLTAAAWATGLAACWWLPMLVHRDLRGPGTSWDLPGLFDHLWLLAGGDRGYVGLVGHVVAIAIVGALAVGMVSRRRDLAALAVLPLGALLSLHLAQRILGLDDPVGMAIPNRGLVFAALLGTLVAARAIEAVVSARRSVVVWLCAAALAALSVADLRPPARAEHAPVHALRETAEVIRAEVPDGARFAFVRGPADLGVPAPERWMAWASGRPGLFQFGPEYAPGSGLAMERGKPPDPQALDAWTDDLRDLAVTHLIVGDPALNSQLHGVVSLQRAWISTPNGPTLEVWELVPSLGHPVGSVVPADSAQVVSASADSHVVEVVSESARPGAALALGWSPGWRVWIDDVQVATRPSADGRLSIDLPAGRHRVRLEFHEPSATHVGRAVTLGTVLFLIARLGRRRLVSRSVGPSRPQRDGMSREARTT